MTQDVHESWQVKKTVLYLGAEGWARAGALEGLQDGPGQRWGGWRAVRWREGRAVLVCHPPHPPVWAWGKDVIRRNVYDHNGMD